MRKAGVIGLGDMGLGMAANLVKGGFETWGLDLRAERMKMLEEAGGHPAADLAGMAAECDAIFLMLLNGGQVHAVTTGEAGFFTLEHSPDLTVIVTATIKPDEVEALIEPAAEAGVSLIDSPVSGGRAGAESGRLTLMTAAAPPIFEANRPLLEAVAGKIFHVGERIGDGQKTKAAMQTMIGSIVAGLSEGMALGTKAGLDPAVLCDVFSNSVAGSPIVSGNCKHIAVRNFTNTGSGMPTLHKDIGISLDLAKQLEVPLPTAAAAFQLFQAGMNRYRDEGINAVVKIIEEMSGQTLP